MQYGNREQMVSEYQKEWAELCELNPELKNIKFDKNNLASLGMAQAGVMYDFPAKDIELFYRNMKKVLGQSPVLMRLVSKGNWQRRALRISVPIGCRRRKRLR